VGIKKPAKLVIGFWEVLCDLYPGFFKALEAKKRRFLRNEVGLGGGITLQSQDTRQLSS
jgi:hypothetical protein